MTKTNGELLKAALDALTELTRRGNHQLDDALQVVTYQYEDYLALKSKVAALEALEEARDAAPTTQAETAGQFEAQASLGRLRAELGRGD